MAMAMTYAAFVPCDNKQQQCICCKTESETKSTGSDQESCPELQNNAAFLKSLRTSQLVCDETINRPKNHPGGFDTSPQDLCFMLGFTASFCSCEAGRHETNLWQCNPICHTDSEQVLTVFTLNKKKRQNTQNRCTKQMEDPLTASKNIYIEWIVVKQSLGQQKLHF